MSFFCMAGTASMMTARSIGDRAWPSRGQVSCSMDALCVCGKAVKHNMCVGLRGGVGGWVGGWGLRVPYCGARLQQRQQLTCV